jgi:hypothetical protein
VKGSRALVWTAGTAICLAAIYAVIQRPTIDPPLIGSASAHADHTPKHGGIFFMAPDGFHHLEGTFRPDTDEFRLYLYDNYTRPIDARQVQARIGNEHLKPVEDGAYLTGQIEHLDGDPPQITAFVRFAPREKEDPFDFAFVPERSR